MKGVLGGERSVDGKGGLHMFSAYTQIDKCVGKEVRVRSGGEDYLGMLVGVYTAYTLPIMVITPLRDGSVEQHIPVVGAVVTVKHESSR